MNFCTAIKRYTYNFYLFYRDEQYEESKVPGSSKHTAAEHDTDDKAFALKEEALAARETEFLKKMKELELKEAKITEAAKEVDPKAAEA